MDQRERLVADIRLVASDMFDISALSSDKVKRLDVFEKVFLCLMKKLLTDASLPAVEEAVDLLAGECVPTHAAGSPCLAPDSPPDRFTQELVHARETFAGDIVIETRIEPAVLSGTGSRGSGFALVIRIARTVK